MSAGPIKAWRDAHKPDKVSTPDAHRVCFKPVKSEKAYCGRKPKAAVIEWPKVTCSDCHAAHRADSAVAA